MAKKPLFRKVMVANRGEIAVRIFHTLQQMGIISVAVYNEADANSLHVRSADEAYLLKGEGLGETYLNIHQIVHLAQTHGVEAIHPGYGFLSENAAFAQACKDAGIVFIGPAPDVIRKMGDKVVSKEIMEKAGVPTLPGYTIQLREDAALPDMKVLHQEAERIGYPILVKAAAGGGGKGMRLVRSADQLEQALSSAANEARNAFGDPRVFLEKYLDRPRHVEFQVFGDNHGNIVHLYERECSIQRRHQKIVEETPCVPLSAEADGRTRQKMAEAAVNAAKAVNYANAGTVEFLLDEQYNFYFLEMNTRLQVEHPITEALVGRDLVREQIRVAVGEPLSFKQADIKPHGHAIECRIYAEDPARNFMPATGKLLAYQLPDSPNVRLDTGVSEGDTVTVYFDPMLAKLAVWGEHREAALERMAWALENFAILGPQHNVPFLRDIVVHPAFKEGKTHTHFLEEHGFISQGAREPEKTPHEAYVIAALVATQAPASASVRLKAGAAAESVGQPLGPWQLAGQWRAY